MARTPFYKLSGAGNDFIVLVEPKEDPDARWVQQVCRRGVSLGADGVFVLRRQDIQVRMVHFNADGGRAELCLNGVRCAVRLASELDWGDSLTIATDSGPVSGQVLDPETVALNWEWQSPQIEVRPLAVEDGEFTVHLVDVGVPYAVLPWEGPLQEVPVVHLGAAIRGHQDLKPEGANVAFVQERLKSVVDMRSFERGVEDETLASGTGVIATAWCLASGSEPFTVVTAAGFELIAEFADGQAYLRGDARLLAQGEICN